jgi:hypothetical protein
VIKELGKYITNNISSLKLGTNFFVGSQPINAKDDHSTLIESGGLADYYLNDKRESRVQVLTKAASYLEARTQAMVIHDFLHGKTGFELPVLQSDETYNVQLIQSVQTPQYLGVDGKGLHILSTNYVVKTQDP